MVIHLRRCPWVADISTKRFLSHFGILVSGMIIVALQASDFSPLAFDSVPSKEICVV